MRGRPLAETAAFRWESANRIALDDLAQLPRARWTAVRYEDLIADPLAAVEPLYRYTGIEFDAALEIRVHGTLPSITPAWDRLRRLAPDGPQRATYSYRSVSAASRSATSARSSAS